MTSWCLADENGGTNDRLPTSVLTWLSHVAPVRKCIGRVDPVRMREDLGL